MEGKMLFLLLLLVPCMASLELGLGINPFGDFDGGDKSSRSSFFNDDDEDSSSNSVFISESSDSMKDGREMITRESEAWTTDPVTGKSIKKRILRHFIKYQNGTVLQVDGPGSGDNEKETDKTSEVECITNEDCRDDFFCDRVSFSCKECLKANETCHKHSQCCEGYLCRKGRCEAVTGIENDPCGNDKDCKDNHCCAYVDGKDVCKPYLEEGEQCGEGTFFSPRFPSFFSKKFIENSRRSRCPCLKGLECKKEESYFMLEPKICTRLVKKVHQKKPNSLKRRKSRQQRQEEMEHDNEINEMNEEDDDEHDRDDDDDNDDDDDDGDEEDRKQSIIDRVPLFLRGLFESLFD